MASISASGTDIAGPTAGSAVSNLRLPALLAASLALSAASDSARIEIALEGLRNGKGLVHICLTRQAKHFPDCAGDPAAVKKSLPAGQAGRFEIANVATGDYALSVIHDENGNGRLDTMLGIPREGFGFSRNPRLRMGPPRFGEVKFAVGPGPIGQTIRMRYIL